MNRVFSAVALVCLGAASPSAEVLDLPLGDPARRGREAPLVLDGVTDTAQGDVFTPAELAARLGPVRLLFVGESHTDMEFHRVQLRVLEELQRAGRRVFVGLEMYPHTEQAALDRWVQGELSEEEFLSASGWYRSWGYHWNYYREIFLFAREKGLRLFGVNAPRDVISAVRRKGFEGLTPAQAVHLPRPIDTDSPEHRRLFRAFFDEGAAVHAPTLSEEQWEGLFRAQCAWDAAMGGHAVEVLRRHGDANTIMVVLLGSGHVAYGLGAERQAARAFEGRMASLVPIPVTDEKGRPNKVRASYANYLWGVPREKDPLFPVLGVSTPEKRNGEHFEVIAVEKDSVGAAAGFAVGDVLLSMDGTAVREKETLNRLMAGKRWADDARFEIRRGRRTLSLLAHFRRRPPVPQTVETAE